MRLTKLLQTPSNRWRFTQDEFDAAIKRNNRTSWWFRVILTFDIWINQICGGHIDESISARCGMAQQDGKLWGKLLAPIINCIMLEYSHCYKAMANDAARAWLTYLDVSNNVAIATFVTKME